MKKTSQKYCQLALAYPCQKYWLGKPKYWGAEGGKK